MMIKTLWGAAAIACAPAIAHGQTMPTMPGMTHDHAAPSPPIASSTAAAAAPAMDHAGMSGMNMTGMTATNGADMDMAAMAVAQGYAAASGTSRLPADDPMQGVHRQVGDWALMLHGYAWGAATHQGGPRGGDMAFVQSMAMIQASRPVAPGVALQLRSMLSLEPLMGQRGYPNLFATGETAHGVALVDRQHPHDLFMELSGRIDVAIGTGTSLFVYGGLPGEPALGPTAFMHRGSARLIPDAPITHHWFDSTHISFGVITAGYAARTWQMEGSLFNGREPGENRYNIETGPLDSWSLRASVTPDRHWAAQISYGHLKEPERSHPGEDEGRLTASVSYAAKGLDLTAGYSRKDRIPGRAREALFAEGTWSVTARHALFGRIETVDNDELFEAAPASPLHDVPFQVTRFTAGYAYTIPLGRVASLALGASGSVYAKPAALDAAYGDKPKSATLFAKLAVGR